MQRIVILIILIILAVYELWSHRSISRPNGWSVASEPEQNPYLSPQPSFQFKETTITKVADYKIKARVISTERYWLGKMAQIAPVDVAVGWKEMSDTSILEKIKFSQADRFYFFEWKDTNLINPLRAINTSVNMHLIPANKYIEDEIKSLRVGHIVTLIGQLVNLQMPSGQQIKSSLTHEDTGPGACEWMWVTNIEIID